MTQWTAAFAVKHFVSGSPLVGVKVFPPELKEVAALYTDLYGHVGFAMSELQSSVNFNFELNGYVTRTAVVTSDSFIVEPRLTVYMQPPFQGYDPQANSQEVWAKIGAFVSGLFDFDEEDDNDARTWAADAEKIRSSKNEEILRRINSLIDGPTGDDDEIALIRIFTALDCNRSREIVNKAGLSRILDDVDGEEWDQIMVVFARCGIVDFGGMDDDASRLYINRLDCSALSLLSVGSIAQLVRNMFSGSCGDDDEDAILKLLGCLSGDTIRALVSQQGTKLEDFDYNFDGDQWDSLEALLRRHGLELDT